MNIRAPDWIMEFTTTEKDGLNKALTLALAFYEHNKPPHDVEADDEVETLRAFEELERLKRAISTR